VELSNLCSLEEATANGEKGFRSSQVIEYKISDEKDLFSPGYISRLSFSRILATQILPL
jgi:hypothetical protein